MCGRGSEISNGTFCLCFELLRGILRESPLERPLLRQIERLDVEILVVEGQREAMWEAGEEFFADRLEWIAGEVQFFKMNHVGEN